MFIKLLNTINKFALKIVGRYIIDTTYVVNSSIYNNIQDIYRFLKKSKKNAPSKIYKILLLKIPFIKYIPIMLKKTQVEQIIKKKQKKHVNLEVIQRLHFLREEYYNKVKVNFNNFFHDYE
jgi:uncharacterized protein YfkK (UPF0435 family)